MKYDLQQYLKADRQWPRIHRLNHAKMMLTKATEVVEKTFWQSVVSANDTKDA